MAISGWCAPAPGATVSQAAHIVCQVRVNGGWVACDCECHDEAPGGG